MNDFTEAINLYTIALSKEEIIKKVALLKRAITYIEAKQYNEAEEDLKLVIINN